MKCPTCVLTILVALTIVTVAGCGESRDFAVDFTATEQRSEENPERHFPVAATKNTTRVPGTDQVQIAAESARATYPGTSRANRPDAVTLVDQSDLPAAAAAAVLANSAVRAPVLFTQGNTVPLETAQALGAMMPKGLAEHNGAQLVRVGSAPSVGSLPGVVIAGEHPAEIAGALDAFAAETTGHVTPNVVVASLDRTEYFLPAIAWAAKSGTPLLFVTGAEVPAATRTALARHGSPNIYTIGPPDVISAPVAKELRRFGSSLTRIGSSTPSANAVAFARFRRGDFGWGITDPGHGFVFVNMRTPMYAAAAASLSAAGTYGPLLLLETPTAIPEVLKSFLLDVQPGYLTNPARGVYNHAWIVGTSGDVSPAVQAQIDQLLEIQPVQLAQGGSAPAGS